MNCTSSFVAIHEHSRISRTETCRASCSSHDDWSVIDTDATRAQVHTPQTHPKTLGPVAAAAESKSYVIMVHSISRFKKVSPNTPVTMVRALRRSKFGRDRVIPQNFLHREPVPHLQNREPEASSRGYIYGAYFPKQQILYHHNSYSDFQKNLPSHNQSLKSPTRRLPK